MTSTHIAIRGGVVTSSVTVSATGEHPNLDEIGRTRFFVEVVEPAGPIVMWDGADYGEAIIAAHELAASWDNGRRVLVVHDLVVVSPEGQA